jgi:hypothetical protein
VSRDRSVDKPKRSWLARLGLQAPPPDPAAWVPVAMGHVNDPVTGASDYASDVVGLLANAGIEARQRPTVVPDDHGLAAAVLVSAPEAVDRIRVAVLVHVRDAEQARALITSTDVSTPGGQSLSEGEAALWLSMGNTPGT